ncbi:MAG TPA: nucleotidyltransferase family protein [Terriglobales bacterium]|nr:nucleotidyltransferase family protein [Terriglobales bacterium]
MAAVASLPETRAAVPLSAEVQLLVGAAMGVAPGQVRALATEVEDWPGLYRLADFHALRAAAYHGLLRAGITLPLSLAELWRSYAEQNARHNLWLSSELLRVMEAFESAGVRVLPYKGPTLGAAVHPSLATRESSDLDLLVSPADAARAEQITAALGYTPLLDLTPRQRAAYLRDECELDLVSAEGEQLDLHWALVPRHSQMAFDFEAWWQRRVPLPLGGRSIPTLAPEDGLLALAVHGSKHAWERMGWAVDFALWMSAHPQMDWEEIARQAAAMRATRALRFAVLVTDAVTGVSPPVPVRAQAGMDRDAWAMAADAVERMQHARKVGDAARWRNTLRLLPDRGARRRCLTWFALTSGVAEWSSVRLPDALFPLYVPVRLLRIVRAALR